MNETSDSSNQKYGSWKFISDIELQDMLDNPVWVWCIQVDKGGIPEGGDETAIRPLLKSVEVPLNHSAPPLILLRIKGTEYFAFGIYDHDMKKLASISVFTKSGCVEPKEIDKLSEPVVYIVNPSINGCRNKEFKSITKNIDEAYSV